jgi:MFS family permease
MMTATVSGRSPMRELRRVVAGQALSSVGSCLTAVTVVLCLAGNGPALGMALTITGLPKFILWVPAGAIADRYSPRLIAAAANGMLGVVLASLGVLAVTGQMQLWEIYTAGLLVGVSSAFLGPAQMALVMQLIPEEPCQMARRANACWHRYSCGAQLASAAAAAMVLAVIPLHRPVQSGGMVFLADAATYAVCLGLSLAVRSAPKRTRPAAGVYRTTHEGLRFVFTERGLLYALLGSAGISAAVTSLLQVSIPVQLEQMPGGGHALGVVTAAFGVGGIIGAGLTSRLQLTPERIVRVLYGATVVEGVLFALAALAGHVWEITVFELATGLLGSFSSISFAMLILRATPEELRARVGSILMFITMTPGVGLYPLVGRLAHGHSQLVYLLAAVVMLAAGLLVPRSKHVQALPFRQCRHGAKTPKARSRAHGYMPTIKRWPLTESLRLCGVQLDGQHSGAAGWPLPRGQPS